MNLGANDKKKVAVLAVLGVAVVYLFYTNVLAGPDIPATSNSTPRATVAAPAPEVKPLQGPEPVVARPFVGPRQPPPPQPEPVKIEPPPPPIPLKFYGYSTARNNGKKTAYFLDNEDILLASEGETVKRR